MYAVPPDLVADCIRAYFVGQHTADPSPFLYKTARVTARFVPETPTVRTGISPTLADVTFRDIPTRPLNDVTMQAVAGLGSGDRGLLRQLLNQASRSRNRTTNTARQNASPRNSSSNGSDGSGAGGGDTGRPPSDQSGGQSGSSQSPSSPSSNRSGRNGAGGGADGRPPSDQSGSQPDSRQSPGSPSSNWRKYLLWSLLGSGSLAGIVGLGWFLPQLWGGPGSIRHDLQRLYQLQLSKSDMLPWLVGGIAGLVRYLMHNEDDESDPVWSALKVALLAGLGTEAVRQYSALSSLGISQPLPKMFQHLLAQIGLATEPDWLKGMDWAKYYDARAQLYAKPPKDDQSSQGSQSSNGAASSTT